LRGWGVNGSTVRPFDKLTAGKLTEGKLTAGRLTAGKVKRSKGKKVKRHPSTVLTAGELRSLELRALLDIS